MLHQYLVYLRKSRADGEHESVEEVLARHEKLLQEYAVRTFGEPVPESCIYREIVSGETIQDRPKICELLDRLQRQDIRGVLTIEPQRLSRGDLSDCGTIIRAFRYTGTLIITPTKTYDLSDKFDRKFFEMELTRGNDYLEYIKEIMMRGRLASVSEGNFIGSVAPYGYETEERLGTTNIANRLNDLGFKPRKGEYWTNPTIRDMLQNPVYIGKIRWNWRKTVKSFEDGEIKKARPRSEVHDRILVDGKHPAIIDDAMYEAAQALFGSAPKTKAAKELKNPLAGIIRCECGKAMVLKPQSKSAPRLLCQQQTHCGNKSATYSEVEEAVIAELSAISEDIKAKIASGEVQHDATEETAGRLLRELNEIETQQNRLYDLLEQGVYSNAVFVKRNQVLSERRSRCEAALAEVQRNSTSHISYEEKQILVAEAISTLKNNSITPKEKNEILKTIILEIKYSRIVPSRTKWDTTPFKLAVSLCF